MTIGWKLLIGAVLLIGAALGGYWKGHHDESMVFDLYKSTQTTKAVVQVANNQRAVAAITASEAQALRDTATSLQENVNDLTHRRDALVADRDRLAGQLRRRLADAHATAALVSDSTTGTARRDAAGDSPLPSGLEQLVEFNGHQFYEADLIAARLTAAQQVIVQDRQICNGKLPGVSP